MNNELNLETKKHLPTYDEIIKGRELLKNFVVKTPLYKSNTFSNLIGTNIFLKNEAFQKTGSFKVRGALYKIIILPEEKMKYGIIAASAGNHAQGVAYAATIRKIPCTIVMPMYASPAKIAAVRSYNAQVILKGNDYDEAWTTAKEIAQNENKIIIHAFDDPEVIAGQGSIGLELLEDLPDLDEVYLPVGGGGLAAGVAIALKSKKRNIKVIGVESKAFPAMKESIEKGSLQTKKGEFTIADGIAVKSPGKLTFEIAKRYLDDIVLIDDDSIVKTMFLLMERSKLVVEPAGVASLAYLLNNGHKNKNKNKKIVSILSGGNVDMYLLGQVVAKGLLQMNRLLKIFVQLPDKPGALKTVVDGISDLNVNIVEVVHDRLSANIAAGTAGVYLSLELEDEKHCDLLINFMKKKGIDFKIIN
ncbi:MAG TPA: threonine ammonia-lyase [Nitrososphaeraceae archaeon]|jgi:threonine dehydratase|nr:threonine ammonia-lyase [Nitrososphaeraceae archaeon]